MGFQIGWEEVVGRRVITVTVDLAEALMVSNHLPALSYAIRELVWHDLSSELTISTSYLDLGPQLGQ